MTWAEFLARIIVVLNLDPLIDVAILVSLAHSVDGVYLTRGEDLTEEEVEEWLEQMTRRGDDG